MGVVPCPGSLVECALRTSAALAQMLPAQSPSGQHPWCVMGNANQNLLFPHELYGQLVDGLDDLDDLDGLDGIAWYHHSRPWFLARCVGEEIAAIRELFEVRYPPGCTGAAKRHHVYTSRYSNVFRCQIKCI